MNGWILDQPRRGTVAYAVDLSPLLVCGAAETLCMPYRKTYDDQVHWNDAGHAKVADAIQRAVFPDCE